MCVSYLPTADQLDLNSRNDNMGKTILLVLVVAMVGVVRSRYNGYPVYTTTPLGDSVDVASMKLLKETYNAAADKNVVASPLGVLTLLSLYAAGAEGANRDEIVTYLGSSDYKQLEDFKQLSQRFASMDHKFLTLVNKVFVSDRYKLADEFVTSARAYHSEVDNLNFRDPKTAADVINQWSAQNTEGKIANPVSESDIDSEATVALLNIIYFKGHWLVPFKASETKLQQFFLDRSSSVQKPMMHLEESMYYHESPELGARLVELPYEEDKFRMIIALPDEVDGLDGLIEKVAGRGLLEAVSKMHPTPVDVILDLPKFEIKSKLDLNELLPKVGVKRIFEDAAPGIVKGTGVAVSRGLQEAFIKVDEEGATAGAFTGLFAIVPQSSNYHPRPPITFKVDHPFLFAILHDDIVLFTGTYTH